MFTKAFLVLGLIAVCYGRELFRCEHPNEYTLRCSYTWQKLKIIQANFGRTRQSTCGGRNSYNMNCRMEGSLKIVQDLCDDKYSCKVRPATSAFGDPCPGVRKYLHINYVCLGDPPINGGWTGWQSWSSCPRTCGGGIQTRKRTCTNPVPLYGGKACPGVATYSRTCAERACPINGEWSLWAYERNGDCSKSCGGGIKSQRRACDHPRPLHGGKQCAGLTYRTKACNTQGCPVNGGLTPFTPFSKCSKLCGGGKSARTRTCTNPPPQNGGRDCVGSLSEEKDCNTHSCERVCEAVNWYDSFDKAGLSDCGKGKKTYINSLYRTLNLKNVHDSIRLLDVVTCCTVDPKTEYFLQDQVCRDADWSRTFDWKNYYNKCPAGHFLSGIKRSAGSTLDHIEGGKCCKPKGAPLKYGHCYDHDISQTFEKHGWSACKAGYFATGLYRGGCNELFCLDKIHCCTLAE